MPRPYQLTKIAGIDLKVWDLPAGSLVLDLGAASGVIAEELAGQGFRVKGIEYDPQLVRQWETSKHSSKVEIIPGDGRKLPYQNGEFDGVVALEVLEHIPETDQVLSELSRVLKPGGRLVVGVPSSWTERLYYRLNPDFAKQADHVHVFTKSSLTNKLVNAGFRVYAIRGENSEYTWLWFGLALARVPFHFTGKTKRATAWEKLYWKGFKLLEILKLRQLLEYLGNALYPRSLYIYAEKI